MSGPSPYLLPAGPVQIAFSGGRTSAYMLHHIAEANGGLPEDRVQVVFTNTGREMPETLDFVAECERRWGIPVARVEFRLGEPGFEVVGHQALARDGEPFEAMVMARRYLPNRVARFCTQELKVRPVNKMLRSLGWEQWTAALGIRHDEPRRVSAERQRERWQPWYPLNDAKVSRHDVVSWWRRQSFDLRLEAIDGKSVLGNCDGCFLKSERFLAGLARDMPERHAWWEGLEAKVAALTGCPPGDAQFTNRYSRASMRRLVEAQGDWLLSDEAGLCQANEGECMA